jgi:hypothetical protein
LLHHRIAPENTLPEREQTTRMNFGSSKTSMNLLIYILRKWEHHL